MTAVLITCWRLGSVDGGTLSSTESDRSAIIKRELISRTSSTSIHNGPLVVRSCTEALASLGSTALCSTAPCANVKGRHISILSTVDLVSSDGITISSARNFGEPINI